MISHDSLNWLCPIISWPRHWSSDRIKILTQKILWRISWHTLIHINNIATFGLSPARHGDFYCFSTGRLVVGVFPPYVIKNDNTHAARWKVGMEVHFYLYKLWHSWKCIIHTSSSSVLWLGSCGLPPLRFTQWPLWNSSWVWG